MAADVRQTWMIRILWRRLRTVRPGNRVNTVNRVVGGSMGNRGAEEQMESRAVEGKEAYKYVVGSLSRADR